MAYDADRYKVVNVNTATYNELKSIKEVTGVSMARLIGLALSRARDSIVRDLKLK